MSARTNMVLTLPEMRRLLAAGRMLDGPSAATLVLSILTLARLQEITSMDAADVGPDGSSVVLRSKGRTVRTLVLNAPAVETVSRLVGCSSSGQIVTGGVGRALCARTFRGDRLRSALAGIDRGTAAIGRTVGLIRRSGAVHLYEADCDQSAIDLMLGWNSELNDAGAPGRVPPDARAVAAIWSGLVDPNGPVRRPPDD